MKSIKVLYFYIFRFTVLLVAFSCEKESTESSDKLSTKPKYENFIISGEAKNNHIYKEYDSLRVYSDCWVRNNSVSIDSFYGDTIFYHYFINYNETIDKSLMDYNENLDTTLTPIQISKGIQIDSNYTWSTCESWLAALFTDNACTKNPPHFMCFNTKVYKAPWNNLGIKYIAIRKKFGEKYYYGWIKLEIINVSEIIIYNSCIVET